MKKLLLLLFACFTSHFIVAQTFFYEKGYIIQGSDTVAGFINRTDELQLSLGIEFSPDSAASSKKTIFLPGDISGFGFTTSDFHFRTVVVSVREKDETQDHKRFAKLLTTGVSNLFLLYLQENELKENTQFVFILQKEEVFYTLNQYKIFNGNRTGTHKKYIGLLTALLNDCPIDLKPRIDELPFRLKPVIDLIKDYNTFTDSHVQAKEYNYKVPPLIKHGPEALVGKTIASDLAGFYPGALLSAGYFFDILHPDLSRTFSYRTGFSFSRSELVVLISHYNSLTNEVEYDRQLFKTNIARVPLLFQFNSIKRPNQKFIPYVNFGVTMALGATNDFEAHIFTPLGTMGAGFYMNKLKAGMVVETLGFSLINSKFVTVSLGYRLDRNQ